MEDVTAAFADGLRPKWLSGLNTIGAPKYKSVAEWLQKGTYGWLPTMSSGVNRLDISGSGTGLTDAVASEISRFSCAAYESLLDSLPEDMPTRSLGWPLVRHYYATFYCAHALLRINGISLTYVPAQIAANLNQIGSQYIGYSPQISSGLYLIEREPGQPNVISLTKLSAGGGSHEDMWKRFLAFLVETENSIISSQGSLPAAQAAVKISKELRAQLCRQGKNDGAWPSTVRNAINYRQDYGVWYPYSRKVEFATDLINRMTRWQPADPLGFEIGGTKDELLCFTDICNVVTQILTSALQDISARSPYAGRSFVDRHAFKLLRHRQITV